MDKMKREEMLFPTWTPCNRHGCAYFHFNLESSSSPLMMAEIRDDKVHISIIDDSIKSIRGCLVLADNHLIYLGGVESQFDYLNMGQQFVNVKVLELNKELIIF